MLTRQKHRADSDSGSQDVWEHHFHPRLWDRVFGRSRSRHRSGRRWLFGKIGGWFCAEQQQLLHSGHAEHAPGLHRRRETEDCKLKVQRRHKAVAQNLAIIGPCLPSNHDRGMYELHPWGKRQRWRSWCQRQFPSVALGVSFLILACGPACSRPDNPQVAFDRAYKSFLHGNLKQSQDQADQKCERFKASSPEWAWKFRTLEAESLLWRGMYAQVLTTLNSAPTRPDNKNSMIKILALEGVAHARLHQFSEAEEKLGTAIQSCQAFADAACGDVIRARGVLAVQHGQIDSAKQFFEQSLQFARVHNDRFQIGR